MMDNICKFLPNDNDVNDINILNFVYETKAQKYKKLRSEAVYKMHIVLSGRGLLHICGDVCKVEKGDVFFTFPAMAYAIESVSDFKYMYISYIGVRANIIMDKINISKNSFYFPGRERLIELWRNSITDDQTILPLRCEGILLYSFSVLGKQMKEIDNSSQTMLQVKKYIDENFSDRDLSLEQISKKCSYNKKYISTAYKKYFKIGISKYISIIRIQHACTLMEQGFSSVKDIAFLCGFTEPLYFSKVFKDKMGISPREYIKNIKKNQNKL